MKYLDETCRTKLRNLNPQLAEMAEQLSRHAHESGAQEAEMTVGFMPPDQVVRGEYEAEMIIRVKRCQQVATCDATPAEAGGE